jgi:ribonuclease HII
LIARPAAATTHAMKQPPDFSHELAALNGGARRVAGVDEVGRGPLAGPVTAAAVWLDPAALPDGLADSKQLSATHRVALAAAIHARADVCIVHVDPAEIDRLNILQASHLAMRRAVAGLRAAPDHVLIDGPHIPAGLDCAAQALVRGDARCLSIAAASIVAKVARDALMRDLAAQYPGYGWERNAGYPTRCHINAIATLGVTPVHRRSFKPVRNMLC